MKRLTVLNKKTGKQVEILETEFNEDWYSKELKPDTETKELKTTEIKTKARKKAE